MFGRVVAVSVEAVMLRRFKAVVVAAVVALGGVSAVQAAPIVIGSVFVLGDPTPLFDDSVPDNGILTVINDTSGAFHDAFNETAVFASIRVEFWSSVGSAVESDAGNRATCVDGAAELCDGSVKPFTFLKSSGSTTNADAPFDGSRALGPGGFQLPELPPGFVGDAGFAAVHFTLVGSLSGRNYGGLVFFDRLFMVGSCAPDETCGESSIYYLPTPNDVPVPEPTSLLLLAGGLGVMAARRGRRRE